MIEVYNILGARVSSLVDGEFNVGYHAATWIGNVSSGLYFYRIQAVSIDDPSLHFGEVSIRGDTS